MPGEIPHTEKNSRHHDTLPSITDLIAEPNLDTLIGYAKKYDAIKGKFVRIGDVVLVAPAVECQPHGYTPQHKDIFSGVRDIEDETLKSKVSISSDQSDPEIWLIGQTGLVDAGWFYFGYRKENDNCTITSLGIGGLSTSFGRADEPERQKTADLVSELTGLEVEVTDYIRL